MKKITLCMLACIAMSQLMAQPQQALDFSWAAQTSSFIHSTSFQLCEGDSVRVTLTTTSACQRNYTLQGNPLSNGHPTTSVLIPSPTLSTPLTLTTTITFTPPVADVRLLLRDLDDDVAPVGPEETFSNFRVNGLLMMPTSITPTSGSYAQISNLVNPLAANCNGWFRFATPNINMITFDYWRATDHYAFLMDSLKVLCNSMFVGTAEPQATATIEMGPNPAGSYLDVSISQKSAATWTATVRDLSGRGVLQVPVSGPQTRLDLDQVSNGTYFLEVTRGKEKLVRKFIVAH